jgi:hypothetical protein
MENIYFSGLRFTKLYQMPLLSQKDSRVLVKLLKYSYLKFPRSTNPLLTWRIVEHLVEKIVEWLSVAQIIKFYKKITITLIKKYIIIGKNMLLILPKNLATKRQHINLVICIYFSFWVTLLVLNQQLKTLIA